MGAVSVAVEAARTPTKAQQFTSALGAFCEAWKAAHGEPYITNVAECTQLRQLVGRLSTSVIERLPAMFARYLQDHDPFTAQAHCHSLLWFCSPKSNAINKYRVVVPVLSVKEARTMDTLRHWEEGSNGTKWDK